MTSATDIAADYFQTLRIPVRAGRTFDSRDTTTSPAVVVVNETLARQYFEDGPALGRRISFAGGPREIIAVVGDVQLKPGWGNNGPLAPMPLAPMPLASCAMGSPTPIRCCRLPRSAA
ncbi:hypothetical protein BH18ACI5_BH18ACI5_30140 [soil metagenome]